jgi:hypothetical protein
MRRQSLMLLALLGALSTAACQSGQPASAPDPRSVDGLPATNAEVQRRIEQAALLYFRENTHPTTGLVRTDANNFTGSPDGATNGRASIAATGYGLAVMTNAAERGLVPVPEARAYAERVLRFAVDHKKAMTYHGWWLHFIDWETGARVEQSEFSTIDTVWFLAGALYAGAVFKDSPVAALADQLLADIDFQDMLTDGGAQPKKLTLTLSYTPEKGYSRSQWDQYAEDLLLLILGLGHPTHPLPAATWDAWTRQKQTLPDGQSLIGLDRALFIHQYDFQFLDLRGKKDGYADYYDNAVRANAYNRAVCLADPAHRTFRQGFWGLSACSAPGGKYEVNTPLHHDGTACLGAAVAAATYDPDTVLGDVRRWLSGPYGGRIWGRYGLADSVNFDDPAAEWVAPGVHAITVGPEFLAFAGQSPETAIGPIFNEITVVKRGLAIAFSKSRAP